MPTSNPVNKEPNLGDYIEQWSKKYLAPSAQEMGAREEYASDLSRFLRAEIKRLRAMAKNAWEHGEFECAECVADLNREFGLPPKRSSPDETTGSVWYPIATAPIREFSQDKWYMPHSDYLLVWNGYSVTIASYHYTKKGKGKWHAAGRITEGLTHWMPLPVAPGSSVEPAERQCDHPRSELLSRKGNQFEMRKCLECTKIFRVRLRSPQGECPTGDYEQAEAIEPQGSRSESPAPSPENGSPVISENNNV